ncbi:hypothetical protein [Fodinicola feengrottensis]|uniref:Uncharacterized protein n=1 Tax=Fodinicola feengrottensis TaxID=435914 RepID=A0ABP4SVT3_9ACTN|nr:hypothetical protein [Fodinicola feengrottensis]
METITYYAKYNERTSPSNPIGVVRHRVIDGQDVDEAFTRNLRWEPTDYLRLYRLGHDDVDHVEITEAEADAFVKRISAKLSGEG